MATEVAILLDEKMVLKNFEKLVTLALMDIARQVDRHEPHSTIATEWDTSPRIVRKAAKKMRSGGTRALQKMARKGVTRRRPNLLGPGTVKARWLHHIGEGLAFDVNLGPY